MTRQEIRQKFRYENPDVTDRVITDTTLNEWMKTANIEVACKTRCIVSNASQTFSSVIDQQYYDLTSQITRFYDIDDMPGGGVYYDSEPIKKATAGEMNQIARNWKSRTSGVPKYYWRRGQYLWLDRKPSAVKTVSVDSILIPADFDSDSSEPFNGLTHLRPFHDSISKYLQSRTKQKIGKQEDAAIAEKDYEKYVDWMKKTVSGYSRSSVFLKVAASS